MSLSDEILRDAERLNAVIARITDPPKLKNALAEAIAELKEVSGELAELSARVTPIAEKFMGQIQPAVAALHAQDSDHPRAGNGFIASAARETRKETRGHTQAQLDQREFSRRGGRARSQKLTKEQIQAQGRLGGIKSGEVRKQKAAALMAEIRKREGK